jgi:hypothetical protein
MSGGANMKKLVMAFLGFISGCVSIPDKVTAIDGIKQGERDIHNEG